MTDGIGLSAVGGGSNVGEEPPQPDNSMMKISSKIAVALHDSHLFKLVQTRTGAFLRISSVCAGPLNVFALTGPVIILRRTKHTSANADSSLWFLRGTLYGYTQLKVTAALSLHAEAN